jgi:hypothetical protein
MHDCATSKCYQSDAVLVRLSATSDNIDYVNLFRETLIQRGCRYGCAHKNARNGISGCECTAMSGVSRLARPNPNDHNPAVAPEETSASTESLLGERQRPAAPEQHSCLGPDQGGVSPGRFRAGLKN